MLRYVEAAGLVVPRRSPTGYRLYHSRDLIQLRALRALKAGFGVEIGDLAFATRLRRDPVLRRAVDNWLAGGAAAWVEWEQRKHERLLAA
jgi:MerR family copper efflux transcriptional regulator